MNLLDVGRRTIGRGVFPYQFSWILELPLRRLILSPQSLAIRLALRAEFSVLEIGPGSGYYSVEVAKQLQAGRLELFDVQEEMLERCRARFVSSGLTNVGYTVGDGSELPFADACFDVVYMVTVFGEISDHDGCLRSVRRVLRPGGLLSISEHLPDPDFTPLGALTRLAASRGLRLERQYGSRAAYTANFRPTRP